MANSFFITGTDTEVGKTVATCLVLRGFTAQGLRTVGMKPVASGCIGAPDGTLLNEDVQAHARASSVSAPRRLVNPYAFIEPVSPHLAAQDAGVEIDIATIVEAHAALSELADVVLVEGAGGWLAPLNRHQHMADMARALNVPVILVVGLRLGCLNHALLTASAIVQSGLSLAGWIANEVDPAMRRKDDNLKYLMNHIQAPCIGYIPYMPETLNCIDEHLAVSEFSLDALL